MQTEPKAIVRLPNPCTEKWEAMQPLNEGQRYCGKCCHAVTDFTNWEADAILQYLRNKKGERVCGRFDSRHIAPLPKVDATSEEVVKYLSFAPFSWMQKIAAIVVISVSLSLASCSSGSMQGKVAPPVSLDSTKQNAQKASGTHPDTAQSLELMGQGIDTLSPPPPPSKKHLKRAVAVIEPEPLMGDPAPIVEGIEPAILPPPPDVPEPPLPVPSTGHQTITSLGGPIEIETADTSSIAPVPISPTKKKRRHR